MIHLQPMEDERWVPDEESRLVADARRHPDHFVLLYSHYARPVFRYLYSRVGGFEEAEDLTAQTFLEALEALPRYRDRGCFAAWLFGIARRKAADHFRRQPPMPLEDIGAVADAVDVQGDVSRKDELERLKALIRELGEEEQEWIRLHFTAGLTFREMAAVNGKSEDATKKAVYRLLAKLQSRLE
ncbi:MAG: sigma-70 family RNA polymerase sigma factor [Anaerolineales bacterium]